MFAGFAEPFASVIGTHSPQTLGNVPYRTVPKSYQSAYQRLVRYVLVRGSYRTIPVPESGTFWYVTQKKVKKNFSAPSARVVTFWLTWLFLFYFLGIKITLGFYHFYFYFSVFLFTFSLPFFFILCFQYISNKIK